MIIASIMKPAYFIIWFSFNINFRFSIKLCSRAQQVKIAQYGNRKQNGRFTLFSNKFLSNIYSILFDCVYCEWIKTLFQKPQQDLGLSYMSCKMLEPKGSAAFLKLTFYTILKFVSHDVWNEDINKLIR